MIEMLKNKSIILFIVLILGVSLISALDTKKVGTHVQGSTDNNQSVLYK